MAASAEPGAGPRVSVVEARRAPLIEEIPLTGTITSARTAALSPRVSGLVREVRVEEGDAVAAGDVLLSLDPALGELALEAARAATAEARAEHAEARRQHEEARRLTANRSIPETQAKAAEAQVSIAAATVARLGAEERRQAEIVARHTVLAPFDGVVARKIAEVGEWVQTGTPVLELVGVDALRLDLRVPQEHYHRLRSDTEVEVRLDALPERRLEGRIATRVPVSDPDSRTLLVRVVLESADIAMMPGMSARAVFRIRATQDAVSVPRDAIVRHPDGGSSVWIVRRKQSQTTVSERRVRLGRGAAGSVAILGGIDAGATVVVKGNETLREGQRVQVVEGG
jgi:RND family efflux transporter MFP subunit